ncbi:hypothetical protein D3C84_1086760 [compost metagenome]
MALVRVARMAICPVMLAPLRLLTPEPATQVGVLGRRIKERPTKQLVYVDLTEGGELLWREGV